MIMLLLNMISLFFFEFIKICFIKGGSVKLNPNHNRKNQKHNHLLSVGEVSSASTLRMAATATSIIHIINHIYNCGFLYFLFFVFYGPRCEQKLHLLHTFSLMLQPTQNRAKSWLKRDKNPKLKPQKYQNLYKTLINLTWLFYSLQSPTLKNYKKEQFSVHFQK